MVPILQNNEQRPRLSIEEDLRQRNVEAPAKEEDEDDDESDVDLSKYELDDDVSFFKFVKREHGDRKDNQIHIMEIIVHFMVK